jgi:hypothetical protein
MKSREDNRIVHAVIGFLTAPLGLLLGVGLLIAI